MHLYRFSYPITKPYPFKWFTPLVTVLGLVLAVLFSFITYPANAYDMIIETTTDPGGFVERNQKSSPFGWLYGDNLKPKCEPYDLSVGSRFFTTNKGFLYTVDKVYRLNSETDHSDVMDQSVPYLNNTLKNCRPNRIIIDLTKDDTAKPPKTWWISWIKNSYFEAAATCELENEDEGRMEINFSMKKSGVAKDEWDYILALDSNASFWWGSQLLNTYWFSLMQVLSKKGYFKEKDKGFYNRGRFTFTFEPGRKKTIHDVNFFNLEFHMVSSSASYNLDEKIWKGSKGRSLDDIYNNPEYDISSAITEGSYFAKVLHSFLVADLANPDIPNMLLNETDLRDFLSGKGNNINRQPNGVLEKESKLKGFEFLDKLTRPKSSTSGNLVPMNQSWEAFSSDLGELGTSDATIYRKYACTGPREKSLGVIVVLVLVADLVFLTTSWKLLNLLAGWLVERQEPTTAMVCAGCLGGKETGRETQIEMQKLVPDDEDGQP